MCFYTLLQPKHIANLKNKCIFDSLGKMYHIFPFKLQNASVPGKKV